MSDPRLDLDLAAIVGRLHRDQLIELGRRWVATVLDLPVGEAEQILDAMVCTLRSIRPEAVRSLSDWQPTESAPTEPPIAPVDNGRGA
jgi:hypothetical protein